ncbi:outer membrane beta-barrel protein [Algibacter pectinivorans]|uniref:Outer membrane protein beta-barrel domain-containing protein n=1 Tax=Algibacter pectinivorans TaxID=870482 RepID=A0A1I1RVP1_9FLAO|nr:outer membrane beta-barrel protein [Algibacter pectinivorans]SFD38167.1 Outer membrane protein beta-barrel domain-containing protein [Algibacter pectinivorans]
MRNTLIVLILVLTSNLAEAQFIKEKSINAQIGYGISVPYNSIDDIADDGFFAQGELVLKIKSWVEIRPYAGFISTSSNGKDLNNNPTNEKAETKAFLLGGKVRVRAPIPWVAPYFELGMGASIGKFETFTAFDNIEKSGIDYHIPFAIGLELGKENNVDLGFTYYFQPNVKQFVGAFALGITFPLNN